MSKKKVLSCTAYPYCYSVGMSAMWNPTGDSCASRIVKFFVWAILFFENQSTFSFKNWLHTKQTAHIQLRLQHFKRPAVPVLTVLRSLQKLYVMFTEWFSGQPSFPHKSENTFLSIASPFPKEHYYCLLEGSQVSPVCNSGKSNM
jgi:hypothetical protein